MFNTKASQLIRQRYSCRTFQKRPLTDGDRRSMETFIERCSTGPFGNHTLFQILAASAYDPARLKKLGTYGFIKDPAAYITGAISDQPGALEDLGFNMEMLILKATELEIGSCWLGGTFTKRRFASQINLEEDLDIPSVTALGYPADRRGWLDRVTRVYAGADRRLPWESLFFTDNLNEPLPVDTAGAYHEPLQLVRLAPSASNKQPWRVLHDGRRWHFYLKRTSQYPPPLVNNLLKIADLQRVDLGIAMAHFHLSTEESGLSGDWLIEDPDLTAELEYIVSWEPIKQ